MKWPVKITRRHQWTMDGYQMAWMCGKVEWHINGNDPGRFGCDISGVRFQVWVAEWLLRLPQLPENFWRWVLGRLWHDRLAFQYERGYADGLREATSEAFQKAFRDATPEEREAMLAEPSYEDMKWGQKL